MGDQGVVDLPTPLDIPVDLHTECTGNWQRWGWATWTVDLPTAGSPGSKEDRVSSACHGSKGPYSRIPADPLFRCTCACVVYACVFVFRLMAVAHVYPRGWMTCVTHFDTGMSEIHSMQAFYQNDSALCHQKRKSLGLCACVMNTDCTYRLCSRVMTLGDSIPM